MCTCMHIPTFPIAALIYADVARAINNLALPNEHEAKAVDARQVGTAMLAAVVFPEQVVCWQD